MSKLSGMALLAAVAGLFVAPLVSSTAVAGAIVYFEFTGTGANGSVASGSFSMEQASLDQLNQDYRGEFSSAWSFPDLILTVSNIPGRGMGSFAFTPESVLFGVDSGGVARIIPGGSLIVGDSVDQLVPDTSFMAPPFTPNYHSVMNFVTTNGTTQVDDITWSAASPVPEPTSALVCSVGASLLLMRLRSRRAQ